jgi:hypothetical protein
LLAAGLENAIGLARDCDESSALVNRQRERLLGVLGLAGLHPGHVDERVPAVRRAVDNGLEVVALEQFAKVFAKYCAVELA